MNIVSLGIDTIVSQGYESNDLPFSQKPRIPLQKRRELWGGALAV